jgi:DNA-binding XRE family transcriptional regulator
MYSMTRKQISKLCDVTYQTVWYLEKGKRYTENVDLAIEMAKFTGKTPIEFITPERKKVYLKAYPELNRKVK